MCAQRQDRPDSGSVPAAIPEAPFDCPLCPRLVRFRDELRLAHPEWFNGPVPSFGDPAARLLVVGLAPGLKGANRTGRPFTGDFAGDLLYETLAAFGFAAGTYRADPYDGLELTGCIVTNAVRCVPPANKPVSSEIAACNRFLQARIASLPQLRAIVALGRIAHKATLDALGLKARHYPFAHAAEHRAGPLRLFDSYHCSRQNTNTGRLTREMFETVFAAAARHLAQPETAAY
jgi:uracil-DNA glycosylase family 4